VFDHDEVRLDVVVGDGAGFRLTGTNGPAAVRRVVGGITGWSALADAVRAAFSVTFVPGDSAPAELAGLALVPVTLIVKSPAAAVPPLLLTTCLITISFGWMSSFVTVHVLSTPATSVTTRLCRSHLKCPSACNRRGECFGNRVRPGSETVDGTSTRSRGRAAGHVAAGTLDVKREVAKPPCRRVVVHDSLDHLQRSGILRNS